MPETSQIPALFDDPNRSSRPQLQTPDPLPLTPDEVAARGWDEVDVVFVTGDAYVDSPSFANGLLARVLEKDGFKVAILSQPAWDSVDDFRKFGRPKLAFCVSAGNMDSMINHYTANRKIRNNDAYSPGGKIGRRPDRATLVYCQRAREAFPGVPIIAGGVEASLRRIAHYDYWSEKVRRSIVFDSKCDLLIYGMGERPMLETMRRLAAGEPIKSIRDVRGSAYRLGKSEDLPEESETIAYLPSYEEVEESGDPEQLAKMAKRKDDPQLAKQAEEARRSRQFFVEMTKIAFANLNPYCAKTLVQEHGEEAVVVNPPALPLSPEEMDAVYALPYTRKAHPSYDETIPASEVTRSSVVTHRGCYGGCSFCAIAAHQGKFVQCRSEDSIVSEIKSLVAESGGARVIDDLNAPTANMYGTGGKNKEICKKCSRVSCLCPTICPNLDVDHSKYIALLKKARAVEGVKKVLIASGVRTDLANYSPEFVEELAAHHTGGHLKTAPEHVDDYVLRLMNKPPIADYERFCDLFLETSKRVGKEQYIVPYLIAGFPGCTIQSMVEVAVYLKKHGVRPEQVQDFIPAPFQLATCAYFTGIDPISGEKLYVPRGLRERALQRALLLYYNPAFYHDVKAALKTAGREDLIGNDEDCLISPYTTRESALRRTSRVKRFVRESERESREQEEAREREREARRFSEKRVGREISGSNGGYRAGAREFGSERPRVRSREWDPIEKRWNRVETPREENRPQNAKQRPRNFERDDFARPKRRFGEFENDARPRDGFARRSDEGKANFRRGVKNDRNREFSRDERGDSFASETRPKRKFERFEKFDRSSKRNERFVDGTFRRDSKSDEKSGRFQSDDSRKSSGKQGFSSRKNEFGKGFNKGKKPGFGGGSKFGGEKRGGGFKRRDG
ncbi:MAG: YgiQ family radical SAM protein [Thermoguttaceae bacterium]|nr:YgiQ family radical SAM protein [Thermoguttaceae bacterium]